MYSGPAPSREIYCGSNLTNHGLVNQGQRFSHFRFHDFRRWDEKLGWLGTGNAELRGQSFFDAFVEHYRRYIDAVDTLTIPHHGSIKNYCGALGEIGQCAVLTSDHMDDPKGFHPSKKVMLNLRTKCRDIFIVTRDMESAVFSTTEVVLN